ncbi:MAG TPA: 4-alpha-glucanotransferase [Bryobacteraceae bacterium]|nr:4-alpha-glucanotransferase [Bryobacteraceae bacterium]
MAEQSDGTPDQIAPDALSIENAARAWGVETDYWDIWGQQHPASTELEAAILSSLGVDATSAAALRKAITLHEHRTWLSPLEPAIFLTLGHFPQEIPVTLAGDQAGAPAVLHLRLEDGTASEIPAALGELPVSEETVFNERRLVRKRVPIAQDLPLGYHQLSITIAGELSAISRLIVCPERSFEPDWLHEGRAAGLAISLYGLRSQRNWGCGDTTDLCALIDWVAERTGCSFVALNPLHAIANRQPYNTSPYLPNSIFYRNPIYLDIEAIPDFGASERAAALIVSPAVQKEIAALRDAELVEYTRVYGLKLRFLRLLFQSFLHNEWREGTSRAGELKKYIEREGRLLHHFAVHSALDQAIHKECPDVWNWKAWPEHYQNPDSAETAEFARKHWRSVLFFKYLQWQLDLQLESAQRHALDRGLSVGLYHDLALATDRLGSDLWAHRDFFVAGCRVGAPPDGFSPKGQDWGFPPPNSERHDADGYRLFAESIRKNCRHGGALRIDHVMRFFRLYWIPDAMEATNGTYVRDRFQQLLSILALESVRNQVIVIGEDLGTVPDEAREVLRRFGILSYRLLYFEQNNGRFRAPNEYPRDALVSATTHDLPTLAGFWIGRDIDARRDAGLLPDPDAYRRMHDDRRREKQKLLDLLFELKLLPDWLPRDASRIPELTGELHNAIVGFLTSTPSKLMVLNQEDLLKQLEQQNLPGSTQEYPNWRRKMKCTVEELWTSNEIRDFTLMFRTWLERTGRLNSPGPDQAK